MRLRFLPAAALALTAGAVATAAPADKTSASKPRVSRAVRHDLSRPLRDMAGTPAPARPDRQVPIHVPPNLAQRHHPTPDAADPVVQTEFNTNTPAPLKSFEGGSDDDNAAVAGGRVVPPDTNGDVGPSHYVQFINSILSVYDKTTGARIFGPVPGNAVWSGFGGLCDTHNDGDPIALYDHLADRWVLSQFAIGSGDDGHQCVAVSQTSDPTGAYYRYDFSMGGPGHFNDYPKLGVWPDGYYLTVNEFQGSFAGVVAAAFERSEMLNGLAAQMVKFDPLPCGTECYFSMQPSDLDGPAPAAGTPNSFVQSWDDETWGTGNNPDGYRIWDFHVDWANPAASTFTFQGQVDAPEFDANLCNFNACALQPRPGERLDTLSQFTMYRAQYRNFGTHQTLVVSHNVDAGKNRPAVRWAELRKTGVTWGLHQTGTIAPPDKLHRWMASAAMDGAGNIAVGYSVSSRNVFPSIRYATRCAGDPLGTLGSEQELVAGAGAQSSSFNRWGDYSSMSVDPTEDTFWFTNEYYANNGSFDFKTRIGAFKGCN